MDSGQFKFENGIVAHDRITGLSGTIVGRCDYLTGCRQYLIQPPVNNGEFVESHWFDEDRINPGHHTPASALADVTNLPKTVDGPDKPAPRK